MDLATLDKYINFISSLAGGINPITKENCKDDEVLCHPDVIRTLFLLLSDLKEIYADMVETYEIEYCGEDDCSEGEIISIFDSNDINEISEKLADLKAETPSSFIGYDDLEGVGKIRVVVKTSYENEAEVAYKWIPIKKPKSDKRRFKICYRRVLRNGKGLAKTCDYINSSQIVENVMPEDLNSPEALEIAKKLVETFNSRDSFKYVFEKIETY